MKLSQNVLIDLDCIIDTRYGLLVQKWGGRVNAVDMQKYRERKTSRVWEHFGVPEKDWCDAYATRDVETLTFSAPTLLYVNLSAIMAAAVMQAMSSPLHKKPTLTINVWPYRLEEWEVDDILLSVGDILGADVTVKCVYIEPANLTPSLIKQQFNGWVLYDLLSWLSLHNEALAKEPMPDVTFFIPSVINVGNESDDVANQTGDGSPFSVLRASLGEYVLIDTIDVTLYCLPDPHL